MLIKTKMAAFLAEYDMVVSEVFDSKNLGVIKVMIAGELTPCVGDTVEGYYYGTFGSEEQAIAATHAIENHDKLVSHCEHLKALLGSCIKAIDSNDTESLSNHSKSAKELLAKLR